MLVSITSTAPDATDLGYLLHKHPDRVLRQDLAVGAATVFYPEATAERCTMALRVEVDPIELARRRGLKARAAEEGQHVTDRPYAAGSIMSVAIGQLFTTALNGRCDSRPELARTPLPLTIRIPAMPARGPELEGEPLVRSLFEPLGWRVSIEAPRWGSAEFAKARGWGSPPTLDVTLAGDVRVADALSHLYVLLPVLDNAKHYWTSDDEVEKLLRRGAGWLPGHPERELVNRRYLGAGRLVRDAAARLDALDGHDAEAAGASGGPDQPDFPAPTPRVGMQEERRAWVLATLRALGVRTVADVGCGEGDYLRPLLEDPAFSRVIGVDVSARELERAARRLGLDRMPDSVRARLTLRQSTATAVDPGLAGLDAILLVEVVEHIDADRHASLEASIFGAARPRHVLVTTPNREHNVIYGMAPDERRHPDHRFEWTRAELREWAQRVAADHGYDVAYAGIGEAHPELGSPTQAAIFTRKDA